MLATAAILTRILNTPSIGSQGINVRRTDTIIRAYVDKRQFSGAVLIARKGKTVFQGAYGMANWDLRIPNALTTKFRLGSLTKQFTAASVLLLEERGKVGLDDSILKYFPEAPTAWSAITVRHLLHHESGIPDIANLPTYPMFKRQLHSKAELLERFSSLPLKFDPGTQHRYSNSGYIVLGQLIERVSGQSYEDFLQENIFKVAGMNDSGLDSTVTIVRNRASGYEDSKSGLKPATYVDMSVPGGAGGLYSTVNDLLKWQLAFFGKKIVSPESYQKMVAPLDGIKPSSTGIGMGLAIEDFSGRKQIFFGGGIEGFNSLLTYDPEDETVIVALSNVNTGWIDVMGGQLSAVSRGEKVVLTSERVEIKLEEKEKRKYVGAYAISDSTDLNIGFDAGNLYVQVAGQDRFTLYPEAKNRFFLRALDAQAEFVQNKDGSYDLLWHQGGSTVRGKKKSMP